MHNHSQQFDLYERKAHYIETLLALYRKLPDTPKRHSRYDRLLAAQLFQQQLPLSLIENAFLLATARRRLRDPA